MHDEVVGTNREVHTTDSDGELGCSGIAGNFIELGGRGDGSRWVERAGNGSGNSYWEQERLGMSGLGLKSWDLPLGSMVRVVPVSTKPTKGANEEELVPPTIAPSMLM